MTWALQSAHSTENGHDVPLLVLLGSAETRFFLIWLILLELVPISKTPVEKPATGAVEMVQRFRALGILLPDPVSVSVQEATGF